MTLVNVFKLPHARPGAEVPDPDALVVRRADESAQRGIERESADEVGVPRERLDTFPR